MSPRPGAHARYGDGRPPATKSWTLGAIATLLGMVGAAGLASYTMEEIGRLLDDALARFMRTEATVEREIEDLQRKLDEKRWELAEMIVRRSKLEEAQRAVERGDVEGER